MIKKRRLLLLPLIILVIAMGYIRDYIFVHINYRLSSIYYNLNYDLPSFLNVFQSLSYNNLYYLKFFITVLFILIYLVFCIAIVKIVYDNRKFIHYTLFTFGGIFFLSCLSYLYGYLFNDYERGYYLSRLFAGLIQSPVIIMILIPAFKLAEMRKFS